MALLFLPFGQTYGVDNVRQCYQVVFSRRGVAVVASIGCAIKFRPSRADLGRSQLITLDGHFVIYVSLSDASSDLHN